jgi:hypothetical protein
MLPRAQQKEVKEKKCYHEFSFKLFGHEFRFVLELS